MEHARVRYSLGGHLADPFSASSGEPLALVEAGANKITARTVANVLTFIHIGLSLFSGLWTVLAIPVEAAR